jgi:hypothetical protein
MKRLFLSVFMVVLFFSGAYAQQKSILDETKNLYEAFEYKRVINLSEEMLQKKDSLSKHDIIEILIMKAASYYALADEAAAKNSFIEMLKTDRNCNLDSENISPKIIALFHEVRSDFLQGAPDQLKTIEPAKQEPAKQGLAKQESDNLEPPNVESDNQGYANWEPLNRPKKKREPAKVQAVSSVNNDYGEFKNSLAKSIILPGWGHICLGDKTKGWLIASAAALSVGSMVYFIANTNKKEKDYHNENNQSLIPDKYDSYNKSYKTKNLLIASSVILWAYAQIDILFLRTDIPSEFSLSAQKISADECAINLNYSLKIPF